MPRVFAIVAALVLAAHCGYAQSAADDDSTDDAQEDSVVVVSLLHSPTAIGVSFGIAGISAQDIVALIDQDLGGAVSANGYGVGATFGASATERFMVKYDAALTYTFLSRSYQFGDDVSGTFNYSYDLNELAAFFHRVFCADAYSLSVGAGAGMIWGIYRKSLSNYGALTRGTATGGVAGVEMILRTAFGGHLFLHTEFRGAATFSQPIRAAGAAPFAIDNAPARNAKFTTYSGSVSAGLDYCF